MAATFIWKALNSPFHSYTQTKFDKQLNVFKSDLRLLYNFKLKHLSISEYMLETKPSRECLIPSESSRRVRDEIKRTKKNNQLVCVDETALKPDEKKCGKKKTRSKKIRIEWSNIRKSSDWMLNCFPTINVRSCKKSLITSSTFCCWILALLSGNSSLLHLNFFALLSDVFSLLLCFVCC